MTERVKIEDHVLGNRIRKGHTNNPHGRPKGAKSKNTKFVEALIAYRATGELPHEFLLRVSQGKPIVISAEGDPEVTVIPDMPTRMEAAKAAAPYFAPRLSAVEVIKGVSDEELDAIIAGAAIEAGITVDLHPQLSDTGEVTWEEDNESE